MISLVLATLNRTAELEKLLASLEEQTYREFEVIVVDQNPDERLGPVLAAHRGLRLRHLRSAKGLSRARNVGLPYATGEVVAFPDDDCWYPPRLLESVQREFAMRPECGVVFATMRDGANNTIGPRWPQRSGYWTKEDIWVCGISPAGFVRREVAAAIGGFNEKIGIGSPTAYQSGEDTDYFVRPLALGWKIWYDPQLTVHHPSFHREDRVRERSYSYALGGGYTLRAHRYPVRRLAVSLVRSLGGAVVSTFKGNLTMARCYAQRAAGLAHGYFLGPRDLAKYELRAEEPFCKAAPQR